LWFLVEKASGRAKSSRVGPQDRAASSIKEESTRPP